MQSSTRRAGREKAATRRSRPRRSSPGSPPLAARGVDARGDRDRRRRRVRRRHLDWRVSSTVVLATGTDQYTMPVAIERFVGRRLDTATAMGVVLLAVTSVSFVIMDRLGDESFGI